MLSSDAAAPVDRPHLSKDHLTGSAPEDWTPLRPDSFYGETGIELRLNSEVIGIDIKARHVITAGGRKVAYDRLLLATGAKPVRSPIAAPSLTQPQERAACS
jgi:NADPH-dependent 2,4-dienoyl-CoA reductase/sulfur reductase-like enzyme